MRSLPDIENVLNSFVYFVKYQAFLILLCKLHILLLTFFKKKLLPSLYLPTAISVVTMKTVISYFFSHYQCLMCLLNGSGHFLHILAKDFKHLYVHIQKN